MDEKQIAREQLARKKLLVERKRAYLKKRRIERKEAKEKREVKILPIMEAKREAGQIALEKLKAARQAIIEYDKKPIGKSRGFLYLDCSLEASALEKEFLKLKMYMRRLMAKE